MSSRPVWFQLIDSDGNPYKGTTADKVSIPPSADVADFRKAVKAECTNKLSSVDAADLLVYKNKDSFRGNGKPLTPSQVLSRCGTGEKHAIAVVVPPNTHSLYSSTPMINIVAGLLEKTLYDAPTSTRARDPLFKQSLVMFYNCQGSTPTTLYCMALNLELPFSVVIAGHLFRRKNELLGHELLGMENMDDERNGMLWFMPIEYAYDCFQLSFLLDTDTQEYRVHVWNPVLKSLPLLKSLKHISNCSPSKASQGVAKEQNLLGQLGLNELPDGWQQSQDPIYAPGTQFDIRTTFGDLHGKMISFRSLKRPFARCLSVQARLARLHAINMGYLDETEPDFEDFFSDFRKKSTVEQWLTTLQH